MDQSLIIDEQSLRSLPPTGKSSTRENRGRSIPVRSCLKRRTSSENRPKKSVHFDRSFSPPRKVLSSERKNSSLLSREERVNSISVTRTSASLIIDCQRRSSISMSTNPAMITIQSDQEDSLNNAMLFPPVQPKFIQTSTLIISPPREYHYYLYPSTHRTISNVSVNSISTSSSSSSCDVDDETLSAVWLPNPSVHFTEERSRPPPPSSIFDQHKNRFSHEDSPQSYSEQLREKSRWISEMISTSDFQSKRNFFENRTTKRSSNDVSSRLFDSSIRTTKKSLQPFVFSSQVNRTATQRSSMSSNFSTELTRNLFPRPEHCRRQRAEQFVSIRLDAADSDELQKQLEQIQTNQSILNDEIDLNNKLGRQLIEIIGSRAETNEMEKIKRHINDIDTITSVLVKVSSRLTKINNDLLDVSSNDTEKKKNLLDQREKMREKYDEAKYLKEGIDRRHRLMTSVLEKYLSQEQCDDYEYFIRMKSTLVMDKKDLEEQIVLLNKQISVNKCDDHVPVSYFKAIPKDR